MVPAARRLRTDLTRLLPAWAPDRIGTAIASSAVFGFSFGQTWTCLDFGFGFGFGFGHGLGLGLALASRCTVDLLNLDIWNSSIPEFSIVSIIARPGHREHAGRLSQNMTTHGWLR